MGKLLMAAEQVDAAESCYLNAQSARARGPALALLSRPHVQDPRAAREIRRGFRTGAAVATERCAHARLARRGVSRAGPSRRGRADVRQGPGARARVRSPRTSARAAWRWRRRTTPGCQTPGAGAGANPRPPPPIIRSPWPTADCATCQGLKRTCGKQGDLQIVPRDPLMKDLDELLQSPKAYDLRGGRALETGDFAGPQLISGRG